jgi:undecaprenyl-diphosphatase
MRSLVNSVAYWDIRFLTSIIALEGTKRLSAIIPWFSHSGNGYYYPFVPLLVYIASPATGLRFLSAGLIAYSLELPLYKLVKHLIKRDRPCEALADVHRRIVPSDRFSFPSGHTAAAFVMAVLIAHFFPLLTVPAVGWAVLVGLSRIYLGVHYPTDILAGMGLGMFCAYCSLQISG